MLKLANFLKKTAQKVVQDSVKAINTLQDQIQYDGNVPTDRKPQMQQESLQTQILKQNALQQTDKMQKSLDSNLNEKPLQNLELQQSKFVSNLSSSRKQKFNNHNKSMKQSSFKDSRVKDIQREKKRIMEQLKWLDEEIMEIKQEKTEGEEMQESQYQKLAKIADDTEAKKQAQHLVKQLNYQRRKLQQKKRKNQQKQLKAHQIQEQIRRKQRLQLQKKLKQQKRQQIKKRLSEQKKKRIERQIIQKQSNQLIAQLKKQDLVEKKQVSPIKDLEQQKSKIAQKRNLFKQGQIQQHQKKYRQFKSKQRQLRRQRSQSIKIRQKAPNYGKNMWIQKLQQEQSRKKNEEKNKQLYRRNQLEKRMKYGDIVKNIFMSKHKKKEEFQDQTQEVRSRKGTEQDMDRKPKTPNVRSNLPQIPKNSIKQNQTDKKFKEKTTHPKSTSVMQNKKSRIIKEVRQKDPQQEQKLRIQKQRQLQMRKQTKQRLNKLEHRSIDKPKSQKVKYENYMGKVKVVKRKDNNEQWKRIMSNQNMSKQQKYIEMLHRANSMENQAKIKEDLKKTGDQDAVNLYIGSIQAKLALLQKF